MAVVIGGVGLRDGRLCVISPVSLYSPRIGAILDFCLVRIGDEALLGDLSGLQEELCSPGLARISCNVAAI